MLAIFLVVVGWPQTSSGSQDEAVVASVNGDPITAGDMDRDLARSLGEIKLGPEQKSQARSASLEKLINQRVVLDFLKSFKLAAGENEVRLKIEELKQNLATVEKSTDDYLKQTNQNKRDLEFKIAWQLSWKRYLEQMLTDEFLEAHFRSNQRQFDGTELRVAHLLLKSDSPASIATQQTKATEIKSQIDLGELTWDQAVIQNSQAPTKDTGGEIGWIKLSGPMPTSFTNAAFKLSAGEISEPITTKFGIHLIRCLEVKPGNFGWRDRLDEVKKSATRELFDAIVAKHRPKVKIEYNKQPK
jgi:parvulin-like peptidyl-prolyl isomerase